MPIQFKIKTISLSAIDVGDRHFRISDTRTRIPLADSIRAMGLLVPPLVIPIDGNRYRIVSGFARIAACQELAVENLLVRIALADTPASELIRAAISENALARELTVMEKARAVTLLQNEIPDPQLLTGAVQSLGIMAGPKLVAKLSRLAHLPIFIQEAVEKEVVGLAMALTLGRLKSDEAQQLICLFQALKLGLNRQRELLTLIQEIAKRDSLSIEAVLAENEISTLLKNVDEERTQCAAAVLHYLKKRRYPALTQREEAFHRFKRKLKLGPKTQFHPPPYFEGTTYQLVIGFDSLDELDRHRLKLAELCADPSLKELFD